MQIMDKHLLLHMNCHLFYLVMLFSSISKALYPSLNRSFYDKKKTGHPRMDFLPFHEPFLC